MTYIYSPSVFDEEYRILEFLAKPKSVKPELYHNKTVIYKNEFKCIINYKNDKDNFYVNYYREEKGKPMTYRSFSKNDKLMSINDFFIKKYDELE